MTENGQVNQWAGAEPETSRKSERTLKDSVDERLSR
jgi:hypothetical protein